MRKRILSIANNLLSKASSWNRVLRGSVALFVVLQLISGMGVARYIASAHGADSIYDDAFTAIAQSSDTSCDDFAAPGPLGNDGPSDDTPFHGTSIVFADAYRQSIPTEGQVAFGLRSGTIKRAIHPTGPPFLS